MQTQDATVTQTRSARDRLLAAAKLVFARDGLQGATTRAIAHEAGVNEVTLFRLFHSKDGLIGEVMESILMQKQIEEPFDTRKEWTGSLKQNLRRYAEACYAIMERDEPLIRTMIGEARRYPEHAKKIILDAVKPERERFIANLQAARKAGQVRRGVNLSVAADAFTGMLLAGMLRHTAHCAEDYSPHDFVTTCVDIFAAGIASPTA